MSNVTTAKSTAATKAPKATATKARGIVAVKADMLARVKSAFSEDGAARARVVGELRAAGYSQRAMIAAATKANRGIPVSGFSTGAVARASLVFDAAIKVGSEGPRMTAVQADKALEALATIANYGGGAALTAAVDMATKATKASDALAALTGAVKAEGTAAIAAATAPAKAKGTKGPKAGRTEGTKAPAAVTKATGQTAAEADTAALATVGISRLVDVLAARLAKSPAVDVATADALQDLVDAAERIIAAAHAPKPKARAKA